VNKLLHDVSGSNLSRRPTVLVVRVLAAAGNGEMDSAPNLGEDGSSKKFARNNGLVVQCGEAEEFHASGKGGRAQRKYIMVSS
jgi:hypothetical protein